MKVLSLTDHDTLSGIPEALEAASRFGIKIIPGVEISTMFTQGSVLIWLNFIPLNRQRYRNYFLALSLCVSLKYSIIPRGLPSIFCFWCFITKLTTLLILEIFKSCHYSNCRNLKVLITGGTLHQMNRCTFLHTTAVVDQQNLIK